MAALLLVNRLTALDDVKPLSAREYWDLLRIVPDPATLLGMPVDGIRKLGFDDDLADRLVRLLDASIPFAFERERLEAGGIRVVSSFDREFPSRLRDRLRDTCPSFLLIGGESGFVEAGGLGVVGSRDISDAGAKVAAEAAAMAARRSDVVVSGLARGVDQIAMAAALDDGGCVTGVPTEGLAKVARNAAVGRYVREGQLCLVSPYGPNSPFTAANAMARNKLVYALADLTLVVASDKGSGGTWSGATEALRRHFGAVAVWLGDGAGVGNDALARMGAMPIESLDQIGTHVELSGQLTLDGLTEETNIVAEHDADAVASVPQAEQPAPRASGPEPTGRCWCGCGTELADGHFFAPRHDATAAANAATAVYGSVETFLAAHHYDDAGPPPIRTPKRKRGSLSRSPSG